MVADLQVSSNCFGGTLFARWKPLLGAKVYEVQICVDSLEEARWRTIKPSPGSKMEIDRLTPGMKVWVRVRGVAKDRIGSWSQPACKIVP